MMHITPSAGMSYLRTGDLPRALRSMPQTNGTGSRVRSQTAPIGSGPQRDLPQDCLSHSNTCRARCQTKRA